MRTSPTPFGTPSSGTPGADDVIIERHERDRSIARDRRRRDERDEAERSVCPAFVACTTRSPFAPARHGRAVAQAIEAALDRDAEAEGRRIKVDVREGRVTLSGVVRCTPSGTPPSAPRNIPSACAPSATVCGSSARPEATTRDHHAALSSSLFRCRERSIRGRHRCSTAIACPHWSPPPRRSSAVQVALVAGDAVRRCGGGLLRSHLPLRRSQHEASLGLSALRGRRDARPTGTNAPIYALRPACHPGGARRSGRG